MMVCIHGAQNMELEDLPFELKTENPLSKASLSLLQLLELCAPRGMNDDLHSWSSRYYVVLFFSEKT